MPPATPAELQQAAVEYRAAKNAHAALVAQFEAGAQAAENARKGLNNAIERIEAARLHLIELAGQE